jgi:hypothetical protein
MLCFCLFNKEKKPSQLPRVLRSFILLPSSTIINPKFPIIALAQEEACPSSEPPVSHSHHLTYFHEVEVAPAIAEGD